MKHASNAALGAWRESVAIPGKPPLHVAITTAPSSARRASPRSAVLPSRALEPVRDVGSSREASGAMAPGAKSPPTCSARHLPGYVENNEALRAKGVDTVACLAVNDVFVMTAWAKEQAVDGHITMLADGSGTFTKALGLELDLTARGLGVRSQRYAMVVRDGRVTQLNVEAPGGFEVSRAEAVLAQL